MSPCVLRCTPRLYEGTDGARCDRALLPDPRDPSHRTTARKFSVRLSAENVVCAACGLKRVYADRWMSARLAESSHRGVETVTHPAGLLPAVPGSGRLA